MSRIAALGAAIEVEGFALAGALVFAAEDDDDVDAMWNAVGDDVGVLILTRRAAERLHPRLQERPLLLTAVMPR